MWLTKLKIAIVEKDIESLDQLINEIPAFEKLEDIQQALSLTQEASKLLLELKANAENSMKQIKQNLKFIKSTQAPNSGQLNIKS